MAVYAKQYGRTGNQLFQKAAAIGYAIKFGRAWTFDANVPKRGYYLLVRELGHHYQQPTREPAPEPYLTVLDGFWQSEKYFAHCREEVLKAFAFNWPHQAGVCSIHVRRGDYLLYPDKHPVITEQYLDQAIAYMAQIVGITQFLVFSDDIEFCKEWIASQVYCGVTFDYSEGRTEKEDLELMSGCEHHIISNSTFSWWGAYLDKNPNKIVVSPSKDNWFGPGNASLCTDDILPDSWIQIKY